MICGLTADQRDVSRFYSVNNTPRTNDVTLSNKISLLDKIKSQPLNTSYRLLAEITAGPKSTISRVLRQESQRTFKIKREGKDPEVEEALDQWSSIVSGKGVSINGPILKAKSEELAKQLGRNDFKATDGWLSRWKARHNTKFKKALGEKGSADNERNFSADDICDADETGLYYRDKPDGSLIHEHIALSGYKKAMDRITVLCCTNMSGAKNGGFTSGVPRKQKCVDDFRNFSKLAY
ncbi:hypothetical protein RF11_03437 [Thelohanellus kitauei]|uniref:HTH CENPB-type domain-containing protein n=1 Tax=Thelohanellus kitauei TaxID=669202 RepID=A0A0C2MQK2_THEKT|nr:hypothetical protein RF11_03437 [Thelohanellus kitauei]